MAFGFSDLFGGVTDFLQSETAASIGTFVQAGATVVAGFLGAVGRVGNVAQDPDSGRRNGLRNL